MEANGTHQTSATAAWRRLEEQLAWYDGKSNAAQTAYKRVKVAQVVVAAAIPVMAATNISRLWLAVAGATLVVLEAIQQLYQWQTNWVLYRATAEALKHERSLYLAHAGPYLARHRPRILAERVEGLVSQEHAKWTQAQEQAIGENAPRALSVEAPREPVGSHPAPTR